MDPNQTLTKLIFLCEQWQEWGELEMSAVETLDDVTELVLALDNWMTQRRGFLPDLWSQYEHYQDGYSLGRHV